MDRAYLDAAVFHELSAGNRHWLTPAKSTTAWRVIEELGKGDQLVEMELSSQARRKHPHLPTRFDVRAIRYQRKGYPPRTLLTSLVDAKQFPGDAVAQELWGLLLAYNLIRLAMERIADETGVAPTRISFVAALRLIAL